MTICEFCTQRQQDGACGLGLSLPKQMSCHKFNPGIGQFCSNPADFVNAAQIIQMANFFGIKGAEMKKVKRLVDETRDLSQPPQHR
jgi:hypothetical protein